MEHIDLAIDQLHLLLKHLLLQDIWERGLDLASLKFPENIGLNYIKEPKFKFENRILDLMNRFNEDELLAFILFAFDFNYYLKKEKKIILITKILKIIPTRYFILNLIIESKNKYTNKKSNSKFIIFNIFKIKFNVMSF